MSEDPYPVRKYAVLQPFALDADEDYTEAARVAALARWNRDASAAGTIVEGPTAVRVDPPKINGEFLGWTYEDEDGNTVESPPMSAWRVEGRVIRHDETRVPD